MSFNYIFLFGLMIDPNISPSQNAQKYYKKYNKAKVTEKYAEEQIDR